VAFHTAADTEHIYVAAADGSGLRRVIGGAGIYRVPRWSRDGRRLAFYSSRGGGRDIWVVDADGGNPHQVTKAAAAPIIFPVWSPDGRMAASEMRPGGRSFTFDPDRPWDEPGNVTVLPRSDNDAQFIPWSWSPAGDRLAGGDRAGDPKLDRPGVVVLTLATGKYTRVTREGKTPVWLPDGQRLLYAVNNKVMRVDLRTGGTREVLNAGAARLELAAGGGFSLSAATGRLYVAPVVRDGDIWFARPR
jgi:Tol biopolymer transport system component